MEFFDVLVHARFATSKTKLDIYYNKLCMWVASRVAKRLKTYNIRKLGNIRKTSNLGGDSLPPGKKIGNISQKVCRSRYQSFIVWSNFTWFPYPATITPPHPTPNCRCAPRNKCNRNIFKCVGRQPQLLFVIFKGGKQLLTATWRTSYNFKTSYFHIAGWTEYLTE